MPDSKPTSTKVTEEQLDQLTGAVPLAYDPAIAAAVLRSLGNLENELFRSGLSKPQQRIIDRIRSRRVILWRMIPEGA